MNPSNPEQLKREKIACRQNPWVQKNGRHRNRKPAELTTGTGNWGKIPVPDFW